MSKKQRRVPVAGSWNNIRRSEFPWWNPTQRQREVAMSKDRLRGEEPRFAQEVQAEWDVEAVRFEAPDLSPLEQIFREPIVLNRQTNQYETRSGLTFSRAEVASARENPAAFVAMIRAKQEEARMGNTSNTWDRFLRENARRRDRDEERLYKAQELILPKGIEARQIVEEFRRGQEQLLNTIQNVYGRLSTQISVLEQRVNAIGQMLEDGYRPRAADPKRPGGRLYRKA